VRVVLLGCDDGEVRRRVDDIVSVFDAGVRLRRYRAFVAFSPASQSS
jgi:hypothetical protein